MNNLITYSFFIKPGKNKPLEDVEALPQFKLGDDIDKWIVKVVLWRSQTKVDEDMHGVLILAALGDLGKECFEAIEEEDLNSRKCFDFILRALEAFDGIKMMWHFSNQSKTMTPISENMFAFPSVSEKFTEDFEKVFQSLTSLFPDRDSA